MIPPGLQKEHFLHAAARIDREGVPARRKSYRYDVFLRGKPYPPKYLISLANCVATGSEELIGGFGAGAAKEYFRSRGYKVDDRQANKASAIVSEDDESAFPEGKERYGLHRSRERDPEIVRKAKAKRLEETGRLQCDVCSLDFKEMYGSRGEGFIEAHHTLPVAALRGRVKTKISDLALVCSNCHRMLHRGKPLLSVYQLREMVRK